jgi:Phosphotransferase enzyme family
MDDEPSASLQARAGAVLGWKPDRWRRVHGGYTPAARYVGALGDARCFLKIATSRTTANMLRREARAYETISGPFVARFIGWQDDPVAPLLLIEDLSTATWPPPWTPALIDGVLEQIAAMHAMTTDLPPVSVSVPQLLGGWSTVAADPQPFLSLGMASADWLARALPALMDAEAACAVDGDSLTHFDLRSDNICITSAGAKFIDWAAAGGGNPALDLGGWLPSLEREGGPAPDAVMPGHPEVAAWISGYFAARAGLPQIPDAPGVRGIQRAQLSTALPWVQRALRLREL